MYRVKRGNFSIVMDESRLSIRVDLVTFFAVNNLTLQYNDKRLQSKDSNACGYYCIYYLMNRCREVPMNEIIRSFSDDLNNNDAFVFDV